MQRRFSDVAIVGSHLPACLTLDGIAGVKEIVVNADFFAV
jgi:hypothetical protein